jgi:hypothetical protein
MLIHSLLSSSQYEVVCERYPPFDSNRMRLVDFLSFLKYAHLLFTDFRMKEIFDKLLGVFSFQDQSELNGSGHAGKLLIVFSFSQYLFVFIHPVLMSFSLYNPDLLFREPVQPGPVDQLVRLPDPLSQGRELAH